MGCHGFAHNSWRLECSGEVRAARRALFLPHQEGACGLTKAVPFKPCVSAETLKACALIGLHLWEAEGEAGSNGSQSLDSGDAGRYGCPKSRDWDSDVESWTESEGTSSEQCEHNVQGLALTVMGQDWSDEKMCLFLEYWELGRLAAA